MLNICMHIVLAMRASMRHGLRTLVAPSQVDFEAIFGLQRFTIKRKQLSY